MSLFDDLAPSDRRSRVGVITHGSLETSGLAPGVYVVVVRVRPEAGPSWTEARRVTVVR